MGNFFSKLFQTPKPQAVNYQATEAQTLAAQKALAPDLYADTANPQWGQPAYSSLQAQTLDNITNGPNGATTVANGANTATRTATVNDLNTLAPRASAAVISSDPYNAALLPALNTSALAGLDAGSGLTDQQTRDLQQQARAAYAARGMGGSNASVDDELLNQFNLGQQLLQRRQEFATQVAGGNNQYVGAPTRALTAGTSDAPQLALASNGQAGPTLFNPAAGNNLAASNASAMNQWRAAQPSTIAQIGQVAGIAGKVIGGIGAL